MSDKFNGFSQDEINRLSSRGNNSNNKQKKFTAVETMKSATFRGGHRGIKRMPIEDKSNYNRRQHQHQQEKLSQIVTQATASVAAANANLVNGIDNKSKMAEQQLKTIKANDDSLDDFNLDRSMSKSIEEALFFQPLKSNQQHKQSAITKSTPVAQNAVASSSNTDSKQSTRSSNDSSILKINNEVDNSQISSTTSSLEDSSILPSTPPISSSKHNVPAVLEVQSPFKGISLKDFESHRKMIEEQNRQKKEMLYKAIEQHSQKTAAEARKIEEIKAELAKLDNDLAVDVALLRKQIDNACIHFATVEKHYMKIESQFLKAKMDLHNAAEKKELLTEHLCTVIAHNEDRKAQKLTELMEKVGLATNGDYEPPTSTSN